MADALTDNACDLERELDWFAEVLNARLKLYFGVDNAPASVLDIAPSDLSNSDSHYACFVRHYELSSGLFQ